MNEIIKYVKIYQKTKDDKIFKKLIDLLNGKIKCYIRKVPHFYKEDVYQEMLMGLYQVVITFKMKKIDSSYIFTSENYKLAMKTKLKYVDFIMKLNYGKEFIRSIEKLENPFKNIEMQKEFMYEYELFCNERQFKSCVSKRCHLTYCYFVRRHQYEFEMKTISLNTMNEYNLELLNLIEDKSNQESYLDHLDLTIEEQEFLKHFIQKGKILTEMEVAEELGISQQVVSKRRKKIIENYKKRKKF